MNATYTTAAILSVNPAAKTVGALHPEFAYTLQRSTEVLAHHTRRAIPSFLRRLVYILTGI